MWRSERPQALDGRSRRRERNAAQLYDAASDLLASRSFDELTVEDICAHAGIGRATFFRIFATKAGLLREFNRRLAHDGAARIASGRNRRHRQAHSVTSAPRSTTPGAPSAPAISGWLEEFVRAAPSNDPHSAHPELLALIVDTISAAVESGELPNAVPVELAASLALIQLVAPMSYVLGGQDVDVDQLAQLLLDQWLRGMGVTSPG